MARFKTWKINLLINKDMTHLSLKYHMIRKFVILFLFAYVSFASSALTLYPYRNEKYKYGFKNELGETILQPQFEHAEEFSEGLAAVKINGRWGYINESGDLIIQPRYEHAGKFHNGHCICIF